MNKRLELAILFAKKKHNGQVRKDLKKTPYITHPLNVLYLVKKERTLYKCG